MASVITASSCVDALVIEPRWIRRTHLDFNRLRIGARLVQFSDLHFKGDQRQLDKVGAAIHQMKPDFICFTGDLVDQKNIDHLRKALDWISQFKKPTFGVAGNHDPVTPQTIQWFKSAFAKTGGAFLMDKTLDLGGWRLHGSSRMLAPEPQSGSPNLLLCHYPKIGDLSLNQSYSLILSGHSHGGQVRIPFVGAPVVPFGVGSYVRGLFEDAPAGPLYVNVGVGCFMIPVRYCCRPELTLIQT